MQSPKIKSFMIISLFILFTCISGLLAGQFRNHLNDPLFQADSTGYEIKDLFIADSGYRVQKIVPCDLNRDGLKDLVIYTRSLSAFMSKYYFLPGQNTGFDTSLVTTILSDSFAVDLFLGDWNMDSNPDLITAKIRFVSEQAATQDEIIVWSMDGTTINQKLLMDVPSDAGDPMMLWSVTDFDLDGRCDLLFGHFGVLGIGWNNNGQLPNYKKITDKGFNSQFAIVYDYNQDGYPDILHDDQYVNQPVIQENQKGDRSFVQRSVGFPKWNPLIATGLYWNFACLWANTDAFPDIFTQRSTNEYSVYELYEFNPQNNKYHKSALQITDDNISGKIIPIHLNNDGYIDFFEVSKNILRFWINDTNTTLIPQEFSSPYTSEIQNLFNLDADNDNDLDVFFSFFNGDVLYEIVNNEEVVNSPPSIPEVDSIFFNDEGVTIEWQESTDDKALAGHINYEMLLESEDGYINVAVHKDSILLENLTPAEYSFTLTARDPLESKSESSVSKNFIVTSTGIIQDKNRLNFYTLNQNYPNPFNPSTTIIYQVKNPGRVSLKIYDLSGREIKTLVNQVQAAGKHSITFDASHLASGIYIYKLQAGSFHQSRKMILLR